MIRAGRFLCETDRPYRNTMSVAVALSLAMHLLLASLRPFAFWEHVEHTPGLEGPNRPAPEISAVDPRRNDPESQVARPSVPRGAFVMMDIEIVPDESPLPSRRIEEPVPKPNPTHLPAPETPRKGALAGAEEEPVIELGEDLSPRTTSRTSMRSEDFAIIKLVQPEYPEISILQDVEGRIRVRALVDTRGQVIEVSVVESAVDLFCENAVIRAMEEWRFQPYRRHGRLVPFTVVVPFRFELED